MQTFPGGMHSGMDYSINDAGILLTETTLEQTRFNIRGIPLAARIRRAVQYANSIEETAAILSRDGNGLSTNEWLLADIKRNEIALLTLGTDRSKLYRSSRTSGSAARRASIGVATTIRTWKCGWRRFPGWKAGLPPWPSSRPRSATRPGCDSTSVSQARSTPTSAAWS